MSRMLTKVQVFLPLLMVAVAWQIAYRYQLVSRELLPAPAMVVQTLLTEVQEGRLWNDVAMSLGRLAAGLAVTIALGTPIGLALGQSAVARRMLLPSIDFLRTLSPLAWMPFVVLFAGVGSPAAVILIILACAPSMIVGATHAALAIPLRHYDVAMLHQLTAWQRFVTITWRGSLVGLVATIRLTMAVGWIVLVAAEMVAGQDGLGYAIMDSRNGMRYDLVIVYMVVIGLIGIGLDRLVFQAKLAPVVHG